MTVGDGTVAVLVALIGALGLVLVAIIPLLVSTRRHAKEANLAVNCKPPDAPKLSEVVDRIAEDVHELRHEQASLATMFAQHLAERDAPAGSG